MFRYLLHYGYTLRSPSRDLKGSDSASCRKLALNDQAVFSTDLLVLLHSWFLSRIFMQNTVVAPLLLLQTVTSRKHSQFFL